MDISRALGIAIFFIGLAALGVAYNASDAPLDQITETLTGRYTDATMAYFAAGMIAVTIGASLFWPDAAPKAQTALHMANAKGSIHHVNRRRDSTASADG